MDREKRLYFVVPLIVAVVFAFLELTFGLNYGIFRDEMYFIQCGEHLDFGYVDHPPMVALIARLSTTLFGNSLIGLRLWPALLGAATVLMSAAIARELGGGRFAQGLAAVSIIAASFFPAIFGTLCIPVIEIALWTAAFWVLIKILNGDSPRLWILFGLITGLCLETKLAALVFGFAVVASLLLTKQRRHLATAWPYFGGAVALVIFLPHVIWQMAHGWPTLTFIILTMEYSISPLSPLEFASQIWRALNPLTVLVWLPGLLYLIFGKEREKYRALGLAVVIALAFFVLQRSKFYYVMPVIPLALVAGAVAWERFTARFRSQALLRGLLVAILLFSGAALMPLAIPILPPVEYLAYENAINLGDIKYERTQEIVLPLHYADRFGWLEMVRELARVYDSLPEAERERCAIVTSNYGEAGAIDYFGGEYGLPPGMSGHNSYWFWGTHGFSGEVMIFIGYSADNLKEVLGDDYAFESIELAAIVDHPYAREFERHLPVLVCRGLNVPLEKVWHHFRHY